MEKIIYFFRGISEYSNFTVFGPEHISILFISILGSIFILKRCKASRKIELVIGNTLLFQQFILYTWYLISGYNQLIEGLPLYHCRLAILFLGTGLVFKKDLLRKIGSMWGLFGSISALTYPGLDPFLFPHVTQFSFFLGHVFLLWGSIYCIAIEKIRVNKHDYKKIVAFTNTYHISMFLLNSLLGSNYGYMNASPIGIGNNLPAVIYGGIIIGLFNFVLKIIHTLLNNQLPKNENSDEVYI